MVEKNELEMKTWDELFDYFIALAYVKNNTKMRDWAQNDIQIRFKPAPPQAQNINSRNFFFFVAKTVMTYIFHNSPHLNSRE